MILVPPSGFTLKVITADGRELLENGRGITPLWKLYNDNSHPLNGALVIDRVIGLGAAVLMTAGKIRSYSTPVISNRALDYFERHGISGLHGEITDYIINRRGDGMCPLEQRLSQVDESDYTEEIRKFVESLSKPQK